jgi:hypothetical protein
VLTIQVLFQVTINVSQQQGQIGCFQLGGQPYLTHAVVLDQAISQGGYQQVEIGLGGRWVGLSTAKVDLQNHGQIVEATVIDLNPG